MKRLASAAAIALSLALSLVVAATSNPAAANGVALDEPLPLPEFSLKDHKGGVFDRKSLKGRWTLVMYGFTFCPDVCPFTLANLEAVRNETALRVRPDNVPRVVFVSVDPDRDRDVLADYVSSFHPEFIGATGSREEIDRLVEATDSFYRFADQEGGYTVHHSSAVAVVDPDGALRAKLQPPLNPGLIAEFLARQQIAYRREKAS